MRLCWPAFAVAMAFLTTPSEAEPVSGGRISQHVQNSRPVIPVSDEVKPPDSETDIFALMSGKCSTLKVAGHDFACRAVAFFQSDQGRANFAIALDDPTDATHIVTFSGQNGRREQENNLYELPIDRMLLNSKDRPKTDGLPVPSVELSAGLCKQIGNIATGGVSSIACTATDKNDKKYELRFDSDGSLMKLMKLRQGPPKPKPRRTRKTEQFECRNKAYEAKVLPRDLTAFIIQCLADSSPSVAPDDRP